ncbi:MAG: hypothetical protein CL840_08740 [Crocinitomicaceae bacterium]|nr:hypothetical protein [Crocinitomicaceae bacterium]|tara:strand:- start:46633 stop:47220 length:588 start_codon:yes stop_codon:yes gene_type:complete
MNIQTEMKNVTQESDEGLVERMGAGEKPAFDELYRRYSDPLFSFFMKMLGRDREKCEDFLQDIFMRLFEKSNYFDLSRQFKPWIYSVAHNMVKNEYKKIQVRQIMSRDADTENIRVNGNSPDAVTEEQLFSEKLNACLLKIDPDKKAAFILKYKEGFAIHEIANIQGVKEGTIKSRLFYVKKYLCNELSEFKPNI